MQEARLVVGTGGWEHEDFNRTLYQEERSGSLEKLSVYARHFDTVEVRSTFWDGSLGAADAQEWVNAVHHNRRFLFNIKLHQSLTHKKEIRGELTRSVRGILQKLAVEEKLGALLIQFPYAFTNTSGHRYHVIKLAQLFSGFPLYAEFRHDSWNQPMLPTFLMDHGLCPVNADFPRTSRLMPFFTWTTGDAAYIRLHGRNEKGWLGSGLDTRYDYLYNGREIREIVRRVEALVRKCRLITLICNNTTNSKAIATALQLVAAFKETKGIPVPARTLAAFPHLSEIAEEKKGMEPLFATAAYRQAS